MEIKKYIFMEIGNLKRGLSGVLDTLNQQEVAWRPGSGCNSIGIILLHIARSEDSMMQSMILGKPQIWESQRWYEKLNLPITDSGSHYTVDQVNSCLVPEVKDLLAYYEAVRTATKEQLNLWTAEDLDKKVTMPNYGELSIGVMLMVIVAHTNQHIGEISYLRGLQRGMDK
jgi:uncharacterized damage-inducible protein DinB